ncbi:MAG TPA: DUF4330 domain-containing protein [Thermoleophilia bacterium]|nr:DUF4330 domain-containing protein [Thermoleophilia bacterium]
MKRFWTWFNWVDVLVVVLILVSAVAILERDRILGNVGSGTQVTSGEKAIVVTMRTASVPLSTTKGFGVGDPLLAGRDIGNARIVSVRYEPSKVYVLRDGSVSRTASNDLCDLYVAFEVVANSSGPYLEWAGQELKVGLVYIMKTPRAEAVGRIVAIDVLE